VAINGSLGPYLLGVAAPNGKNAATDLTAAGNPEVEQPLSRHASFESASGILSASYSFPNPVLNSAITGMVANNRISLKPTAYLPNKGRRAERNGSPS